MAGGAHGVGCRAERRIARWSCLDLGKRRLAVHPRQVVRGLVNHNPAAHGVMCDTTQLFTENFVFTQFGWFQPHVRHHAWHGVHLDPELSDGEVMQYVFRAQPELHRFAEGEMHDGVVDQNVILSVRVVRIDAEQVLGANQFGIDRPEFAIFAGKTKTPVPLLADNFYFSCAFGNRYEFGPDKQSRRQHRGDTDGRQNGEPDLQFFVFRFVLRCRVFPVAVANDRVGHEKINGNEYDAGHNKCDVDGAVDHSPI